jgi:tight adherence protein B
MRMRWTGAAAAVVAFALAGAAPAGADEGLRLSEASGGAFPERSYVLTLPAPRALDAGDVRVTENGRAVDSLTVLPPGGASAHRFGVVLAIDVSRSMRGRPLEAAVTAARRFVRHRNPTQPVAVVTFAGAARVAQPFTTDAAAVDHALTAIRIDRGRTHLIDAVGVATRLIEAAHVDSGSVVLLSDGGDHGSVTTREDATKAASAARVRIFPIGLVSGDEDFGTLNLVAAETHGEFSPAASVRDLTRIYDRLGSRLAGQYLIRYRSSVAPDERVVVEAAVRGLAGKATALYETPAAPRTGKAPFHRSPASALWRSPAAVALAILAAALLVAMALWLLLRPSGMSAVARMAAYVDPPEEPAPTKESDRTPRMLGGAARTFDATAWGVRLSDRLEIARITMPPAQLAGCVAAGTLVVGLLMTAIGGPALGLLALAVPAFAAAVVSRKLREQRTLFRDQLPDNLQIVASAMRAGHSFSGALSVVVEDAPEPTRRELTRVLADERLGVPLDEALEVMVHRMASKEFAQVALVATLQRETGGNTAEVLDRVTDTVRERLALQRMIKTLTAQGRMSRWVVSALPVALLAIITLINPEYMAPLYEEPIGRVLLVVAGGMVVTGSLVIKRLVDIKV